MKTINIKQLEDLTIKHGLISNEIIRAFEELQDCQDDISVEANGETKTIKVSTAMIDIGKVGPDSPYFGEIKTKYPKPFNLVSERELIAKEISELTLQDYGVPLKNLTFFDVVKIGVAIREASEIIKN